LLLTREKSSKTMIDNLIILLYNRSMLFPDSAASYQAELHNGLLREIAAGIEYDHSCGMIAIEIGKRLLQTSGSLPDLAIVKSEDGQKLLPIIYSGRDGFGTHMVAVHEGLVFDVLAPEPLPTPLYPEGVFINSDITLRYCEADFTAAQLRREESTLYEDGL
jgi:hypothetical protein